MKHIPWQHDCCFVRRYMPLEDGRSIRQIIEELDSLAERGYGAIQITAPYDSPGFHPWWGLRIRDPFRLSPVLGASMEDFCELVRQCHVRGLRVLVFLNLGYGDISSELWKIACRERRQGLDTPRVRFFRWSDTGTEPPPAAADPCFPREEWWAWSEEAQSYYRAFWNGENTVPGLYEPQFDWSSPALRDYTARILRHWLDTGLDGVILDAVNRYLGCDMGTLSRWCESCLAGYPGVCLIPEGATGFGDQAISWLDAGFAVLEDQMFHSDWLGSAILDGVKSGSAAGIKARLENCRLTQSRGRVCWSYLCWGDAWIPRLRLLEIALLLATGHMTEIIPGYLSDFSEEDRAMLDRLTRLSRYPFLSPARARHFPDTAQDAIFQCGGDSWIFAASFSGDAQYFIPELSGGRILRDLISGRIYKSEHKIALEPYGWCFLEIRRQSEADWGKPSL